MLGMAIVMALYLSINLAYAYVLSIDNIVPKDAVLDAQSVPKVQMPNRSGFINWEPRLIRP